MKNPRQIVGMLLKLGLAVGVLGYLLHKMGLNKLGGTLKGLAGEWPWLLAGFLLCLPPLLLCMARWKRILDAQGMRLGWSKVNSIFFIGLFFNSFMIGPTGGDLMKAYYTARETRHQKTEAVTTIFIDRIIGLYAMALLVGTVILIRWDFFAANPAIRGAVAWPMLVACLTIIVGGAIAFGVHLFELCPWLRRLNHIPAVGKIMETVERAYNAFYVCRANPKLLVALLLYSFVIQLVFVVASWCVGQALGLTVSFLDYLTFGPLIGLISAIPITPGGTGIRELASIKLWGTLGVTDDRALLLAFIPFLYLVLWGIPGGLLFLFHKSDKEDESHA